MKFIMPPVMVLFVCVMTANGLLAQDASSARGGSNIPEAPENLILDETGFFRERAEELAVIAGGLERMREKHHYPVYLVIYYSVFEGSLQDRANELHAAWIGERKNGMVLVYQRDPVAEGSNPAIAFYQGSELDASDAYEDLPDNLIPKRDTEAILANAFRGLDSPPEEPVSYLAGIVAGIERELNAYFEVEPPKWNDSSNLRMMAIFVGVVAALALLGLLLWKILARADSKSSQLYHFPEVKIGRRLGAPYGGGWTSERKFPPSSSRE